MAIEILQDAPRRWLVHSRTLSDGHGGDDVFHVQFDPESESVIQQTVKAVATITNSDPTELTPLAECVEPDMLETFVDPDANCGMYCSEISFEYEGLDITLNPEGDLWLEWCDSPA